MGVSGLIGLLVYRATDSVTAESLEVEEVFVLLLDSQREQKKVRLDQQQEGKTLR
jgi:hypothetical protein